MDCLNMGADQYLMKKSERRGRDLRVASRLRQVRVAYLIDPVKTSLNLVGAIFSACGGSWGGRLSPIIPVIEGSISPAYWRLLRIVDPDQIYSYADLPQALLDKLMAEIDPVRIERHNPRFLEGEDPYLWPSDSTWCTSVVNLLSIVPSLTWPKPERASLVTYRAGNGAPADRLIAYNFGILKGDDLPEQVSRELQTVAFDHTFDFASFLEHVSSQSGPITFPYSTAANRAVVDTGDDWRDYTLFVGDDVADWVAFWNHVFTMRPGSRERWRALCIPLAELQQERTIDALRRFLRKFAYAVGNGPATVNCISSEQSDTELRAVCAPLFSRHINVLFQFSSRAAWFFPQIQERERYTFQFRGTEFGAATLLGATLHQVPCSGGLVDIPSLPFGTRPGDRWMCDVRIEYPSPRPYFLNEDLGYQLPRRNGISSQFCGLPGRVDADGGLSFERQSRDPLLLKIPDDGDLIASAIGLRRRLTYDELFRRKEVKPAYEDACASDKARYCRGVINLCGGLWSAHRMFQSRFWRRNLEKLAGSRRNRDATQNQGMIYEKIRKHPERWSIDPNVPLDDEVRRLQSEIEKLMRHVEVGEGETTYEFLIQDFKKEREEFLRLNPDFAPKTDEERDEDLVDTELSLKMKMQEMTNAKIFQQGTIARCSHCGSRNWRELSRLRQRFSCDGCGASVHSGVEARWYYRLNALMRSAIAEHGTVALVSGLARAREKARLAFLYSPGFLFFERYEDQSPKVEVDAVCLVDGEVWVGEIKSNVSEFKEREMRKLTDEAKRLGADKAFVFAMLGDQNALEQRCSATSQTAGIQVVQLRPSQFASQPAFHL
jgi:hypothetical protein